MANGNFTKGHSRKKNKADLSDINVLTKYKDVIKKGLKQIASKPIWISDNE